MGNKFKFEFDFDEVLEGIKQGVIRELSEMEFDGAKDAAIRDVKAELKKAIQLSYSDVSEVKNEIKNELKTRVYDEILKETKERYLSQLNEYLENQLLRNPDRLSCVQDEVKDEAVSLLYSNLYRDVRSEIQNKINNVLNLIGGAGVKIQGSGQTISQEEYEELLQSDRKLCALERAGVDNWEGYDFAIDLMDEED